MVKMLFPSMCSPSIDSPFLSSHKQKYKHKCKNKVDYTMAHYYQQRHNDSSTLDNCTRIPSCQWIVRRLQFLSFPLPRTQQHEKLKTVYACMRCKCIYDLLWIAWSQVECTFRKWYKFCLFVTGKRNVSANWMQCACVCCTNKQYVWWWWCCLFPDNSPFDFSSFLCSTLHAYTDHAAIWWYKYVWLAFFSLFCLCRCISLLLSFYE